jgi:hypothetical protein
MIKLLLDVIEFFPKSANDWKAKGWKPASRWRFLESFKTAAQNINSQNITEIV